MNSLLQGMQTKDNYTENGMPTNSSTSNSLLDFFFTAGAMRAAESSKIISKFLAAYNENPLIATKLLFWARDIREGAGERRLFRIITESMQIGNEKKTLLKNLKHIPEYGRWDDLVYIFDKTKSKTIQKEIISIIRKGLEDKNGLCAKWLPRKGFLAKRIREALKLTPKEYRMILVSMSNTVEQLMCSGNWDKIDFNKVPSVASSRYKTAFFKHAETLYRSWLEKLQKGEKGVKINAGAVYPYDIINGLRNSYSNTSIEVSIEQWKALPNYFPENNEFRLLPVVDVSGSMTSRVSYSQITCMDISMSLGIYISEKNVGPFKDAFITFSYNPKLQYLKGDLQSKIKQLSNINLAENTNIQATFDLILNTAIRDKISENEMPTHILILSDMEFDRCTNNYNDTVMEMINRKYKEAGYKRPSIIFWNIQSRNDNFPCKFKEQGTALVSGFSPSILKSLLSGEITNPIEILLKTIDIDRYKNIVA